MILLFCAVSPGYFPVERDLLPRQISFSVEGFFLGGGDFIVVYINISFCVFHQEDASGGILNCRFVFFMNI